MKRSLSAALISLALLSGLADAARRSGGGFGGSRSLPRTSTPWPSRTTVPLPPRNTGAGSGYTAPPVAARSSAGAQRQAALPSTASVRSSPANRAAAARVTPSQLSAWKAAPLPPGVPRSALTYSAAKSSAYQHQLQPGRYYPYPQSYYRTNGIGSSLLRYALIFMAVDAVAGAVAPDRPPTGDAAATPAGDLSTGDLSTGDLGDVPASTGAANEALPATGLNLWSSAGVGLLAAGAAWFVLGRRKANRPR